MAPVQVSQAWRSRLYGSLLALSSLSLALFILGFLGAGNGALPAVPLIGGALAGLAAIGAAVMVFVKKVAEQTPYIGVGVYLLHLAALGYCAFSTATPDAFFTILWALAALAAPLFGAAGIVGALIGAGVSCTVLYLNGSLSITTGALVAAHSLAPLSIGAYLWSLLRAGDTRETRDIKHLASQLSEVANKSEIIINAIGDGVFAVDGKGIVQLINPAGQQILGWGKRDAVSLHYKSIFPLTDENNHDVDPSQDPIQQVLNTNQETRGNKLTTATQSGKKLSLSIVASPIGTPGSGAIVVFRDVTKERAEEREQAEFISTASHEMRTPVASIEGYLGLALNPNTAQIDERARDFIMKAHESAEHLGRLFQDLLDVSKSEDGRLTQTPRVVDMVQYAQTITEGLIQKATAKNLQLIFKPADASAQRKIMPVYFVNQDNDHIREIVDNLIENAIKYTPEGTVTVDVSGTEDTVVVSVTDTGLGIPKEDLTHLFQKFYRVDNVDRQSIGGTGLGLYLSRRLAESMQGRLWAESDYGKGSTFFLELPRVEGQEAQRLKDEQEKQTKQAATPAPAPVQPVGITIEPVLPVRMQQAPQPAPVQAPVAQAPATTQPATAPTPVVAAPQPQPQAQPRPQQPQIQTAPSAQTPAPRPVMEPVLQPAPRPQPVQTPVAAPAPQAVQPATTVPRGESLTREQIAERVRQLEAMAAAERSQPRPRV